MNDEQLLRYSRQIMLPQVDVQGQQRLLDSTALIVGMGGLGAPTAMYLAAAGIGHLVLADFDTVDLSNLQRQIVHRTQDIGRPKVVSARDTLASLNPEVRLTAIDSRLDNARLATQVHEADVVLDCSDNFATRFAVNAACVATQTPLVSGAAIRMEGQVGVFANRADSPCYRCLYREGEDVQLTCSETGVLAPVVGVIGSVQAVEAIKVLLGIGAPLDGRLLIYDALGAEWRAVMLRKDPGCPVCGTPG
ncbi:MAG: molybdopterin-synthase adenylyltransferase MoeB [Pseudomonadota bacterium]|nr:MAG: molybdopterin-synthase adenylyltransferase MoeB [Pseudomonadota bacterium]